MNALKTVLDKLDSETSPLPKRIMVDVLTLREAAADLAELQADNARLRLVESAARKLLGTNPTRRWVVDENNVLTEDEMNALDEALKGDVS